MNEKEMETPLGIDIIHLGGEDTAKRSFEFWILGFEWREKQTFKQF